MDLESQPETLEGWMRRMEARVRRLERHRHPVSDSLSTLSWDISEDENGDLIAVRKSDSKTVIIAD